jgi:hypothetical protein
MLNKSFGQAAVDYIPSTENFANPERGFYTQYSATNETGSLTATQMTSIRNKKQSIILRLYYLTNYKTTDLSSAFLLTLENDFKMLRQNGIKCVLRFAYTSKNGVPDASLAMVLRHLDQLGPVLTQYSDVIAFLQAGFIGPWGEWHDSMNGLDNTASRKAILEKELSVLPKDRMVQVRTPSFKNAIFSNYSPIQKADAFNGSNYSRTGHHNDCFLADATDMGTYSDTTFGKNYISADGNYVPVGGETCGVSEFSTCSPSIYQMKRLHWTYLNNDYHQSVLSGWKTNGCYPEMQNRLGYRFELLSGNYANATKQGGSLSIDLSLRNVGFASLFNPRDVEFILRSSKDTFFVKIPIEPRSWKSDDTTTISTVLGIPAEMESGDYSLFLNLPDPSKALHFTPGFSIQFANTGVWEAATGYNNLGVVVNVKPENVSQDYTGDLYFAKINKTTSVQDNNAPINYDMYIKNYPNPFNNTTEIVYSINEPGNVKINLFNSIGENVTEIVNEYKDKGVYAVNFNTSSVGHGLSSGIYFYVLNTASRIVSGKMILLK